MPESQTGRMTPLWVISLFVSLTELVAGFAVTRATGSVQVALTVFVILFPLLIAAAFFIILWYRPYVLYPPTEFGSGADVGTYVRAMTNKVAEVNSELQVEAAALRASIGLDADAISARIEALETGLRDLLVGHSELREIAAQYDQNRAARVLPVDQERVRFTENARISIEVAALDKAGHEQLHTATEIAGKLAHLGYKAVGRGWPAEKYLTERYEQLHPNKMYTIHRDRDRELALTVTETLQELFPNADIEPITLDEAVLSSAKSVRNFILESSTDIAVVFRSLQM